MLSRTKAECRHMIDSDAIGEYFISFGISTRTVSKTSYPKSKRQTA